MAKMKTFAVEVEFKIRRTVYVDARRPNGAAEELMTDDGWRKAMAYQDDVDLHFQRADATIIDVREANL